MSEDDFHLGVDIEAIDVWLNHRLVSMLIDYFLDQAILNVVNEEIDRTVIVSIGFLRDINTSWKTNYN